jgi:two-component system chemotaxis sensor kinase CheA
VNTRDDHIKKAFAEESLDHLSSIEEDLIRIEKGDTGPDRERINKVFRAVHSIKGGSGFLGIENITRLAHAMETVLGHVREGTLTSNAEVTHFLLQASDALTNMIHYMDHSDKIDITGTVTALENICPDLRKTPDRFETPNGISGVPCGSAPQAQPDAGPGSGDESMVIRAQDGTSMFVLKKADFQRLTGETHLVYVIEMPIETDDDPVETLLNPVLSRIKDYGTLLEHRIEKHHTPMAGADSSGPFILLLYASVLAEEEIRMIFRLGDRWIHPVDDTGRFPPAGTMDGTLAQSRRQDSSPPDREIPETDPPAAAPCPETGNSNPVKTVDSEKGHPGSRMIQNRVRVDLTLLDNLMTLAGEMVLSRNQLLQAITTRDFQAIQQVGQRINGVTSELQETVMLTRMQPMEKVFDRFPRLVRDLSASLGKKIDLVIKGRRVELDKNLLEAVTDPLLHLVRNSIDHGIEPPDIRENQGKNPAGKVVLKASHGAGKIFIEIIDDGRGMDPDKLAERAVTLGLIPGSQVRTMDGKAKMNLIFMPGFSTSRQVNDLSGRGVGMDVVKNNIEAIGGKVTIESQPGLGSRFLIQVPLTLAIIPCQIIQTESQRFAIPQANLEELVRIPPGRISKAVEFISGAPVIRLREELLPLVRLSDILRMPRTYVCPDTGAVKTDRRHHIADRRSSETDAFENPERRGMSGKDRRFHAASALNIAVVSTGSLTYGLIVDELQDAEEIVVKPLGRHLKTCGAYAGATIMGDGQVALILDISALAETAALYPVKRPDRSSEKEARRLAQNQGTRSFLTFRGAPGERFAMPLDRVIHIEKIPARNMETMGNMTVVRTRNTTLPVCALDEVANIHPVPVEEVMVVVVCDLGDRTMGLRVTGPVDAVETHDPMDGQTLSQPGISGSLTIDGHTVMVVAPDQVAAKRFPQWYKALPASGKSKSNDPGDGKTILIAEDSAFFRNLLKTRIKEAGFHVMAAEDGQMALDLIKAHVKELSVVITDMEMPRMDGFTLTRNIKNDPELAHLPVIALSTLADDSDLKKGREAGVDDYQIKLDQEKLLKSIHAHIKDT